jgi:hypothetical protein
MTERILLPPDHPQAPKYWMNETGGRLIPAVRRYLADEPVEPGDTDLIRAYLRQWIDSPVWDAGPVDADGPTELAKLRKEVRELRNRADITAWLEHALDLAIDPL